ncbi:MAG: enoyl-CoA hydratase-related protein, partial [Pseudohongiellaceae bacterium]
MVFEGKAIRVERLESGVARLIFDRGDASVNKFDRLTLEELTAAVSALEKVDITGLVICSGKDSFIVGADITEFSAIFASPADQIVAWLAEANALFNRIEDLPAPTVCAIQGNCLGGGFELALTADYRIATETARVGFPEVKLGIIPGFGGTVRMPRLVGADNANQWISSAASYASEVAFKEGALDALVAPEQLLDAAEDLIAQCRDGKLDYQARRKRKTSPLLLGPVEVNVAFQTAKALVTAKAGPHYPAPIAAVSTMEKAASMDRAGALAVEHEAFAKLAKTDVAANLIQLFLNEQYLKGKSKKIIANARPVNSAAVLGAGIMGGGISYQSALKGVPVIMKDIAQEGLDLGLKEVGKLLGKQVQRGRLGNEDMLRVMSSIRPSLSYSDFDQVDVVVEAVVENPGVKKKVLQ